MLLQNALPPPGAEIFHAVVKRFVSGGMGSLHQLLQHFPLHQPHFSLIGNAESRIQADFVKMVPQQEKAKTVDGSDLGIVQQSGLFLDMLRLRLFIQLCGYS